MNHFKAKAVAVIRKRADFVGDYIGALWDADEQETWRQLNALDPIERSDIEWDAHRPPHMLDDAAHEQRKARARTLLRAALETRSPEAINEYLDWLMGRGWWH